MLKLRLPVKDRSQSRVTLYRTALGTEQRCVTFIPDKYSGPLPPVKLNKMTAKYHYEDL